MTASTLSRWKRSGWSSSAAAFKNHSNLTSTEDWRTHSQKTSSNSLRTSSILSTTSSSLEVWLYLRALVRKEPVSSKIKFSICSSVTSTKVNLKSSEETLWLHLHKQLTSTIAYTLVILKTLYSNVIATKNYKAVAVIFSALTQAHSSLLCTTVF